MTKKPLEINGKDDELIALVEENVKEVLKSKRSKQSDKVASMQIALKLLLIRHKIGGGDEENFFSK